MFVKIILGISITIFFIGCDSNQLKKFKNGATIVCVKKHYFGKNDGVIINSDNSLPSSEEYGSGPMVTGSRDGYMVKGIFYSEDDCAVIN